MKGWVSWASGDSESWKGRRMKISQLGWVKINEPGNEFTQQQWKVVRDDESPCYHRWRNGGVFCNGPTRGLLQGEKGEK